MWLDKELVTLYAVSIICTAGSIYLISSKKYD